jgi:hypothetical protein
LAKSLRPGGLFFRDGTPVELAYTPIALGRLALPHSDRMDANLQSTLNLICHALADAYRLGGTTLSPVTGISVLTEDAVDNYIPGEVFNIAVSARWIEPHEVEEGKGPVLGDYIVEDDQREWFLSLLAPSLSFLREGAAKNTEYVLNQVAERNNAALQFMANAAKQNVASPEDTANKRGLAREKIDDYLRRSQEVFDLQEFVLQKVAPIARKYKRGVSYASVRRIYVGGSVSLSIRQIVAEALSELLPCTRDNLLPSAEKRQGRT